LSQKSSQHVAKEKSSDYTQEPIWISEGKKHTWLHGLALNFLCQCESSKKEILLLKFDFPKAFDTINHSAMLKIMRQMSFDNKWINWIDIIFSYGMSVVLLNGVPGR
jgi:hypothetical protein